MMEISAIFFAYFSCTLMFTQAKAWEMDPAHFCRTEDGFHRCLGCPSSKNASDICVWRTMLPDMHDCIVPAATRSQVSPPKFPYLQKDIPKLEPNMKSCLFNESECCKSQLFELNCTDDEIQIKNICYPRYTESFGRRFFLCHSDEFRCLHSKKCIHRAWVQNGVVDCSIHKIEDRSDEENFLPNCDPKTEYRCPGRKLRCILRHHVMDGKEHCRNGADEINSLTCHNDTEFLCMSNGRCILRRYVNDNFSDCRDSEDEHVDNFKCIDHLEFSCRNGRCIPRKWVGNGVKDCSDGEDETQTLHKCFNGEFGCLDQSRCLPKQYLCDGVQHCGDGSDEIELCKSPTMYRPPHNSQLFPWSVYLSEKPENQATVQPKLKLEFGFKCHITVSQYVFNKVSDTLQASVELLTVPQFYVDNNHSICYHKEDACYDERGTFKCARCFDGTIISTSQLCDNKVDCRDLSDECTCEESDVEGLCEMLYPSSSPQHNSEQNTFELICDGHVDFSNNLDEKFCHGFNEANKIHESKTHNEHFTCQIPHLQEISKTKPVASYCNRIPECPLNEDECSSDCLNYTSILNLSREKSKNLIKNCFPFLKNSDDVHVLHFTTMANIYSSITDTASEILVNPQTKTLDLNTESTQVCNYILSLPYPSYFFQNPLRIVEFNHTDHCKMNGEYLNLDFLCNIKGVDCPWLYSCESDKREKIEISKRCDYNIDCKDESDENNCSAETHFYCTDGNPLFVPKDRVTDRISDCHDRSDECKETAISSILEMIKNEFLRYYLWAASICILFSNIFVIQMGFSKVKKIVSKKSIPFWSTTLLINLAFSDIIFGFILLMIGVKSFQFSGDYCKFDLEWRSSLICNMIGILTVISSQTSMNILVLMTGLRLFTTYRPYSANELNMKLLALLTFLCWAVSVFIAVYPISNEMFTYSVYIKPNLFFNDHVVTKSHFEKYFTRVKQIFSVSTSSHTITRSSNGSDFNSLNDWDFSTKEGSAKFPNRHADVKGYFGFYSSSSVCFPDLYSSISPSSDYSFALISYNLISLVVIGVGYVLIFRRVKRQRRSSTRRSRVSAADQEHNKMMRRIIYIVLTDMMCWIPIITMSILSYFGCELDDIVHPISTIVFLPINSFVNPIIYSRLDRSARLRLTKLLALVRSKNKSAASSSISGELVELQKTC